MLHSLAIPLDDSIEQFAFVIQSAHENAGWRIAMVSPSDLSPSKTYTIPDLLTLPKLEDDAHERIYRKALKAHDFELE